jgi:ribonuclease Z
MVDHMKEMLFWHMENFSAGSPIGQGYDIEVNEFDYTNDGGLAYEKNGVRITHWQQSHGSDGASAYRLDWNGMSVCFTATDARTR